VLARYRDLCFLYRDITERIYTVSRKLDKKTIKNFYQSRQRFDNPVALAISTPYLSHFTGKKETQRNVGSRTCDPMVAFLQEMNDFLPWEMI
jgi:hypothetical protein